MNRARLLQRLRFLFSTLVTFSAILVTCLLVIELLTPGDPEDAKIQMTGESTSEPVTLNGHRYTQITSNILTEDYEFLNARLIIPADGSSTHMPLIVAAAAFLTPDEMLSLIGPFGRNALLLYMPPHMNDFRYGFIKEPSGDSFFGQVWTSVRANPIYRGLAMHRLLHEGARNIVRLVSWAERTAPIDRSRVNFIGFALGNIMISSAIVGLQKNGITPRSTVLIFPPADLAVTLQYNLPRFPGRAAVSHVAAFLLRRLDLANTLPEVTRDKLLILPAHNLQIPTAAALPAVGYTREPKAVKHIDLDFTYWNNLKFITPIRDTIRSWLMEKKAISEF